MENSLKPISVRAGLEVGETAYLELPAKRLADETVEKTVSKRRRGILGGMVMRGYVRGWKATTTQETKPAQIIDEGRLILTSNRFLFVGNTVVSIPYDKLVEVTFVATLTGKKIPVKYEGMLPNEQYAVKGDQAKVVEAYYQRLSGNQIG